MAECQGCIAEQNIEHTCSLRPEGKPDDDDLRIEDSDLNTSHQQKHQQHHHHHHTQQQSQHHQQHEHHVEPQQHPKMAQRHSLGQQGGDHHRQQPHRHSDQHLPPHHPHHHHQQQQQPQADKTDNASHDQGDQTIDSEEAATPDEGTGGASNLGRNTWPRKRQLRQVAHVGSIFNPDAPDNSSDLTATEARPAGAAPAMYFVSFDDSVCNASSNSSGPDVKRIPRNSRNPLPPELATVKKGTPLYGQPSWWGDPDEEGEEDHSTSSSSKHDGDKKSANKKTRPSNLGLSGEEAAGTTTSAAAAAGTKKSGVMDGERVKPHQSAVYMEIPIKDDDSPEGADDSKDTVTPAKSVSSSLSKDSLSVSPDLKQAHSSKSAKMQSPSAEVNPATSFTIDLDDPEHPPKKSLNIGSSLSEFVPPKVRKNFLERKDRGISSKTGSKESTPSKNSEERELSPLHQRKIDEIWSVVVEGKGKANRLSSMQATAGSSSLRSPNLEDIDRLSELSEERRSSDREVDKKAAVKKPVPSKSPQISRSSRTKSSSSTALASSAKSPAAVGITAAHSTASVNVSQYSDPTSYLIDKMFEGGTSSATALSDKELSPEQKMYREAASHDKTASARRSTEKAVVRPIIDTTKVSHGATASKNGLKDASEKKAKKPVVQDEDEDDLRITEDIPDDDEDEVVVVEKEEDKASEAGTYTIEADMEEGQEEEEARKKIDKVFGVDVEDFTSDHPQIDPLRLASPGGYDNVYDDFDNTDGDKTPLDENGHSPFDDDDDNDLVLDDDYDENSDMAATDGVQPWVHQLTALTNQKVSKSADSPRTPVDDADASLSKKPPQGLSRKRPGTGRKLPSIPTDRSPVDSEHSSYLGDQDLSIGDDVPSGKTPDHTVNGKNNTASNGRPTRISSQTRSRTMNNGYPDSVSQDGASAASPSSSRSRGSVDTELLLQDTETVMAAMEARMAHKGNRDRKNTYSVDSDTDALSARSLVNGDDDYVKPTLYNSPREALAKRQQRESSAKSANNNASATPPTTPGKKPVGRSYSQTVASKTKSVASPRGTPSAPSGAKRSIVSDVFSSRRDSMDNDSIISDVSSETGDGNLSRSSSKGKGTISMAKPNRAFALRRARADSFDEPTTPRSAKSAASTKSSGSSARSSSLHSNTRTRSAVDTNRSEATSLGAQIVRKSQSNSAQDRARRSSGASVGRTDSGRNSLRLQRASSLTIAQTPPGPTSSKREPTPKSHLRSTPTGKGSLSISGISSSISSRSQSQPGSRSNSPKAAERAAWKRRKDYDPRRAVAEAKAKAVKEGGSSSGVTMRPKPSASSNIKRRMIRSASFTNSAGLSSVGVNSSVSSSQDFIMDRRDHYEHEDFRRAFIPFHNSLRTDRSTHSADEDDSLVSANSAQASYDSLIVSSIYQISLKLKTSTDKSLNKLREQNRVSHTPSPVDDFLSDSGKSEITAWKSANQELAGILKNLRKLERHVQMMNSVLFPEDEINSEVSSALPVGHQEKQRYYQEMKRIRSEIAGFQPIDHPKPDESEIASPEMAELSEQFT